MAMRSDRSLQQAAGAAFLTRRSVLMGAIMSFIIGIAGPYWTFYLGTGYLFPDYSVGGAIFFLFVLVLISNGVLGTVWKPLALKPGELVVVAGMMLIAGAITTMGLVGYLIPNITAPYYLASAANDWESQLWPHLPAWISPLDRDGGTSSIMKFYTKLNEGEPVPWGPWIKPLALWGVFLAALYGSMTSMMAIVRKQWVDYERLSYPIAQVSEELCATAARPWGRGSLFRSVLFWSGFAVPVLISLNPDLRLATVIKEIGPIPLRIYLSFAVLAFTFLIPNRVAFSLWFLNLVSFALRSVLKAHGLEMHENLGIYGASPYPMMAHQGMGAMIVFVVASLWFSRRHLKRVFQCASGRSHRGYDATEPASYRASLIILLVSLTVMVVWMWQAGLPLHHSVVFIFVAILIFFGLTRIVAQCGVSVTISPMIAPAFMTSTFGGSNIVGKGVVALTMSWVWNSDIRTSVMSSATHAMYLARRNARKLLAVLLLAAAVTFLTATLWTVYLGYRHGAANLQKWYFTDGPKSTFEWGLGQIRASKPPNLAGYLWTAVGGGIMALLIVAQRILFWWPIHPVAFIICSVIWTDVYWFSIFLAWLIKLAIVRVGGNKMFRLVRRFFLGMVVGSFTGPAVGAIVATVKDLL